MIRHLSHYVTLPKETFSQTLRERERERERVEKIFLESGTRPLAPLKQNDEIKTNSSSGLEVVLSSYNIN